LRSITNRHEAAAAKQFFAMARIIANGSNTPAMRGKFDPQWTQLVQEWRQAQLSLRQRMIIAPLQPLPRFVAGADAAFSSDKKTVFAAAVVYDRQTQQTIEIVHATRPAEFPYVPGFLSFAKGPAVLAAIHKLQHDFGVICFDAQGYTPAGGYRGRKTQTEQLDSHHTRRHL
jgi:hypothetical protein